MGIRRKEEMNLNLSEKGIYHRHCRRTANEFLNILKKNKGPQGPLFIFLVGISIAGLYPVCSIPKESNTV